MAAAVAAPASAAELVEAAEEALVLSDFGAAEQSARQCLARAAYLAPGAAAEALRDRACLVALQALAETQRFGSAHRLLRDTFGQRLEDAPPHSLLLWLALALDTERRGDAQLLIQSLLDSLDPGRAGCCWSRRQYLALLHLYCFEVLLKELREPAEVQRWVEDTQLPISEDERQLLWAELAQAAEEEAARRQQSPRRQWEQQPAPARGSDASAAGAAPAAAGSVREQAAAAAARQQQANKPRAEQQRQRRQQQQQGLGAGSQPAPGSSGVRAPAAAAPPRLPALEIEPALEEAPTAFDRLARWQQQAAQLVSAVLRPLVPQGLLPGAAQHRQSGGPAARQEAPADPAVALRTLGGTVLGAVLLYALYAERAAVRSGLQRARRGVASGLAELAGMALSMRVNPVAAAAPGLR